MATPIIRAARARVDIMTPLTPISKVVVTWWKPLAIVVWLLFWAKSRPTDLKTFRSILFRWAEKLRCIKDRVLNVGKEQHSKLFR